MEIFIILWYLFRQRAGQVRHVPKENLCCASVLSESQAVRRSESLASARHNEERERVFVGTAANCPFFMSEQSARKRKNAHKLLNNILNYIDNPPQILIQSIK